MEGEANDSACQAARAALQVLNAAAALDPAAAPRAALLQRAADYREAIAAVERALLLPAPGPSDDAAGALVDSGQGGADTATTTATAAAAAAAADDDDHQQQQQHNSQQQLSLALPPGCTPIHANVTTFDWASFASTHQFDLIMVDPPWQLATANPTRGVALGYSQLSDAAVAALPLPALQREGGLLLLWTINAKFTVALDLLDHWGYE